MKSVPVALKAHLAGPVTSVCTCWLIQRRDGVYLRYTDHDANIFISTEGAPLNGTYVSAVGYTGSSLANSSDGSVDNLEVAALYGDELTEADLQAGIYDFAEVKLFLLNWAAPSMGIMKLRRGWLGQVSLRDGQFTAELRGMQQKLQQTIGEVYSPACRADLGDGRCKVNLASYTVTGSVTSVTSRARFTDAARTAAANWFKDGLLTWASGANNGRQKEVKAFASGGVFTLVEPLPQAIVIGDTFSVYAGCNKLLQKHADGTYGGDCKDKFDNVVNFHGEPVIPGFDAMVQTPDAG